MGSNEFRLEVPIDASEVAGRRAQENVKVVVVDGAGKARSSIVTLDEKGHGAATFAFAAPPGAVRVFLGPESATDQTMQELQTLSVTLPARQLALSNHHKLTPIFVPPIYWEWWRRWCRTFVIRGRVLCPDGSPVPGATVNAFDVDKWWWWSSKGSVGSAVTDASGAFTIRFLWCCGYQPFYWWHRRTWQLEPYLLERIGAVLQQEPRLARLPAAVPTPSLRVFEELIGDPIASAAPQAIDPARLAEVQPRLQKLLPPAAELQALGVWPWVPWYPWFDCSPDLIFRVTQSCRGVETVIVDEDVSATRWNVPPALDVTLVAGPDACCIDRDDQTPPGDCIVITQVCGTLVAHIGGNPSAPAAPVGYAGPGTADRPFGGNLGISGLFGAATVADYYEFEWSNNGGGSWNDMPSSAAGGFDRWFWGPPVGAPLPTPPTWNLVPFAVKPIDGRNVIESREHYEATHDPGTWGTWRHWGSNRDFLMDWRTANLFSDGTYQLRVKSWTAGAGGTLTNPRILPLCDTQDDNGVVVRLDNRVEGPGSGHPPSTFDHPCGSGTVHTCTLEPDTVIREIRINGVKVKPCDIVDATAGGPLEIDFVAHDPDGHLSSYSLIATWGANLARNLLTVTGATVVAGPATALAPPAIWPGPSYAQVLADAAAALVPSPSPTWAGGSLTLHIPDLRDAFPDPCAYQLELRAYKRTIVNCHTDHQNLSETSFTVKV